MSVNYHVNSQYTRRFHVNPVMYTVQTYSFEMIIGFPSRIVNLIIKRDLLAPRDMTTIKGKRRHGGVGVGRDLTIVPKQ